jgi:hypothetical protein
VKEMKEVKKQAMDVLQRVITAGLVQQMPQIDSVERIVEH